MTDEKRPSRLNDDLGGDARRRRAAEAKQEAAEPEGIRRGEQPRRSPRDEDEFVTDAELEARELDSPPKEEE
jgi:hypothetical protein